MTVYFIGGSPCSGKSIVAKAISENYHLRYFKVDDYLDKYLGMAAEDGKPCCAAVANMTPEQIWMREPAVQCEEELKIYEEIFPYILADLAKESENGNVITEGAAYLPLLAKQSNIPPERYLSITPTKEFQVSHYREREWVHYVLDGCSDKEKAFDNWMERDALFAIAVQQQCRDMDYASIINHGDVPENEMLALVGEHFGMAQRGGE